MIRRTMDATLLNMVANHPEVRPYMGAGDHPLDLGPTLSNPQNVALLAEGGGWVFMAKMPGLYELHTLFTPGQSATGAWVEAARFMFTRTDALEIVTFCPDDNAAARMAAGRVGFRERFRRENAWAPGVGISYRVYSVDDWLARDAECLAEGGRFHDVLAKAKWKDESDLPIHEDDEAHDRAVGAAVLMARRGQMAKGVALYNRWAVIAGYAQIETVSPTVVDVRDAVIEVTPEGLNVLMVRGVS